LNEIQERVDALAYINNLSEEMQINIMGLVSKTGELCKEFNKITDYGKKSFVTTTDFEIKIGKIFHSLILVANSAGVDLENALDETLKT